MKIISLHGQITLDQLNGALERLKKKNGSCGWAMLFLWNTDTNNHSYNIFAKRELNQG